MLRAVAYTLGAIILISLLRGVIGLAIKTGRDLMSPKPTEPKGDQVKCPACGSIVPGPLGGRNVGP
jgi:hypothetical protein